MDRYTSRHDFTSLRRPVRSRWCPRHERQNGKKRPFLKQKAAWPYAGWPPTTSGLIVSTQVGQSTERLMIFGDSLRPCRLFGALKKQYNISIVFFKAPNKRHSLNESPKSHQTLGRFSYTISPEVVGDHPAYGHAASCFKKGRFYRFGAHGTGTTGTTPAISDAENRVGTYIYPYEPTTGSGSGVGSRGDRRQTLHTNLLAYHLNTRGLGD